MAYELELQRFHEARVHCDEIERYCNSGPNAGKPGPCPMNQGAAGGAGGGAASPQSHWQAAAGHEKNMAAHMGKFKAMKKQHQAAQQEYGGKSLQAEDIRKKMEHHGQEAQKSHTAAGDSYAAAAKSHEGKVAHHVKEHKAWKQAHEKARKKYGADSKQAKYTQAKMEHHKSQAFGHNTAMGDAKEKAFKLGRFD